MIKNVSRFKDLELEQADMNFPICGLPHVNHKRIYSILREKYEDQIGQLLLSKPDYENKNSFGWVALVEDKIQALTFITGFMLSRKKPVALGSLSNNGKQDKTLSTILSFPKKAIAITKAARFAYPNIVEDVKELKQIFSQTGCSMKFGLKKGIIVHKLRSMSSNRKETHLNIVKCIDTLRRVPLNKNTQLRKHVCLIANKRWSSLQSPIVGLDFLYSPDTALNNSLNTEDSIKEYNKLQNDCSVELDLMIMNLLEEAVAHVEIQLNLKIMKTFSEIEKLMAYTIDTVELNKNGNYTTALYKPIKLNQNKKIYKNKASSSVSLLSFGTTIQR